MAGSFRDSNGRAPSNHHLRRKQANTNDTSSICNGHMGFIIHKAFHFHHTLERFAPCRGPWEGKQPSFLRPSLVKPKTLMRKKHNKTSRQEMLSHPKTQKYVQVHQSQRPDKTIDNSLTKNDIMLAAERISDATSILLICHVEASSRRGLIPQPLLAWDLDLPVSNLSGSFGSSERLGGPDM